MYPANATVTAVAVSDDTDTWQPTVNPGSPAWQGAWPAYYTEQAARRRDANGADVTRTSRTLILQGGRGAPAPQVTDVVTFQLDDGQPQDAVVEQASSSRGHRLMPDSMRTIRLKLEDSA